MNIQFFILDRCVVKVINVEPEDEFKWTLLLHVNNHIVFEEWLPEQFTISSVSCVLKGNKIENISVYL